MQDGQPPVPLRTTLPLLPKFCLYDIHEHLLKFNPSGLPVEVYIPTTRLWELFGDEQTSVTFAPATTEILVSLRLSYLEGFKVKPGLNELLSRQPRRGQMSKRAAIEELVSPRKTKLPRHLDAPRIGFFSPSKSQSVIPHLNFEDETPAPPSPTPLPPPSLSPLPLPPQTSLPLLPQTSLPSSQPLPLLPPGTFPLPLNPVQVQEKSVRFPTHWLAYIILQKTSEYVQQRERKHGSFPKIFKQVFGLDHYPKTTASQLPQLYPAAYEHFCSLNYGVQMTITWSKLINQFEVKKSDSVGKRFIYFTHPTPPSTLEHATSPLKLITLPEPLEHGPPQPSPSPETHAPTTPPKTHPLTTLPPMSLPTMVPFPLDKTTLQPLDPEQQASLEADFNLVQETRKALGDLVVDTEIDQLIGGGTYSGFNAQDILKEHQAVASLSGWPNPPDFLSLPQRVWEKQVYLNSIILEIQMGSAGASRFYKHLFSIGAAERYLQSLEVMSAG